MIGAPRQDLLLAEPAVFGNSHIITENGMIVKHNFFFFLKKLRRIPSAEFLSVPVQGKTLTGFVAVNIHTVRGSQFDVEYQGVAACD